MIKINKYKILDFIRFVSVIFKIDHKAIRAKHIKGSSEFACLENKFQLSVPNVSKTAIEAVSSLTRRLASR